MTQYTLTLTDPGMHNKTVEDVSLEDVAGILAENRDYTKAWLKPHNSRIVQIWTREPTYEDFRDEWFACRFRGPRIGLRHLSEANTEESG